MNRKSRPLWQLLLATSNTESPPDLTCDECFSVFEYFFDMGQSLPIARATLLKQIRLHMNGCPNCRQQYEAKLAKMEKGLSANQ